MENKDRTRVCKYAQCKHNDKVHIDLEPFYKDKYGYYHEDCYKEKTDLQLFRELWVKHISPTVVYSELNKILNSFISRGITSDYLLFVLQYIINHNHKLRYPAGLQYYLDKQYIKDAYKQINKKIISNSEFTAQEDNDNSPKFSVNTTKTGFGSILGGNNGNI